MILRKIKQLFGLGSERKSSRSDQEITLQQESEPDTETEGAVKGVDETEADEAEPGDDEVDEPVAADTDAGASTESLVDEAETEDHPESRAEPAEAAGPGTDDETTDDDEVDPAEEQEPESPDVDTGEADADGTPVDEVKGIGPAYSDRLGEIGIHSIEQLAAADAEEIAGRIAVAEKTVEKWVDRAQERSD